MSILTRSALDEQYESIPFGNGDAEDHGCRAGLSDADTDPQDNGSSEPQEEYVPSPSEQMALDTAVANAVAKLRAGNSRISAVQPSRSEQWMFYSDGTRKGRVEHWMFVAILERPCDSVLGSGTSIDAAIADTLRKADAKNPEDPTVIDLVPALEASIADVAARKAAAL